MHLTVVSYQIVFPNILGAKLAFFQIIRARIYSVAFGWFPCQFHKIWAVAVYLIKWNKLDNTHARACLIKPIVFMSMGHSVHGRVNGYVLKLACGLLINKQAPSYALIDARIQLTQGHQWIPPQIVTDFEGGIISALQNVFPGRPIHGCYFHFAKAVWSRAQELGLVPVFNNNPDVKMIIKKLMAFGFIPLNLVHMNYRLLRNVPGLIATFPQLQVFFTYFENTWVNVNNRFLSILWNIYQQLMEFRSNNAVESFNHVWNAAVGVRHPSLWLFIRVLKDKQAAHEATKQNMINSVPRRCRRKWRRLEANIDRLQTQYQNGQRTVDYWEVCYMLNRYHQ